MSAAADTSAPCPAVVSSFVATDLEGDEDARGPSRVFGIVVRARKKEPMATYRIDLASDDRVYSVAVPLQFDTHPELLGGFESKPVYVRFDRALTVHDAWVGAVGSARALVPCRPNNVSSDRPGLRVSANAPELVAARKRVVEGAGSASAIAIDEQQSRPALAPACSVPESIGRTLSAPAPRQPFFGEITGIARVLVSLNAASEVAAVRILDSTIGPTASAEALRVTRAARFETARYRCQPIPHDYVFVVQFR